MHVAHVGDSRCYRLRAGDLELLTQDHSLLTDVLEQRPDIDEEVLAGLPKNIVTRAIGLEGQLRVSIRSFAVVEQDRYLLCSDGLSGPVTAAELAELLASGEPAGSVVERLIDRALANGGPDNIAALVIDCQGGHKSALPADSVPPPSEGETSSEPELLILGIQDLVVADAVSASDDLLKAIEDLLGNR